MEGEENGRKINQMEENMSIEIEYREKEEKEGESPHDNGLVHPLDTETHGKEKKGMITG